MASPESIARIPSDRDSGGPPGEGPGAKRRVYRFGAVLVLLIAPIVALGSAHPLGVQVLHLLWAAHIGLVGELVGTGRLSRRTGGALSSLGGVVLLPSIVLATGHPIGNALAVALVAMPLILSAVAPDDRGSVIIFSVGGLGWIAAIEVISGQPAAHVAEAMAVGLCCSSVALVATSTHARAQAEWRRATAERISALEQLAESERRRANSERLVVIGQLAAGIAHEINNPLAFVTANLKYLSTAAKSAGPSDPEVVAAFAETEQGLARIHRIVRDLTQFSRASDDDRGPCDAGPAVQEALRLASVRLHGSTVVEARIPPTLPPIRISHQRLVQVLVNLLVNAIDAMESLPASGGSAIRVGARATTTDAVELTVDDTGPGIPVADLPRIFDPFFTTKPAGEGTGLGLALCREYLEDAGGSVRAENRAQGGARFTLTVPATPTSPGSERAPGNEASRSRPAAHEGATP